MCGIAGVLTFAPEVSACAGELARSLALVARRGPDDTGVWSDGAYCMLGFRRLAVLDLSPAGHQPLVTDDGRYALVCNGEIYNFRALRERLRTEGIRVRSTGDAEVVLQSLVRWGVDALRMFNGMFALAFYDAQQRQLLLARDHAGMKPLYVRRGEDGLAFGSQYDQLAVHPWLPRDAVRPDALGLYLRFDYIPAPYALHTGTMMLEAGSWLTIDAGNREARGRFYDFPVDRVPDLRADEAFDAVDAAVTAAVRRHLVSDVPVGSFLSGGIDSPLVATLMQSMLDHPVPAFTLGLAGEAEDESEDARRYAREIGVEHIVVELTPSDAPSLVESACAACAEPFGDYSILPTLLVSRAARQRVTVMLSGDAGDELFWGYVSRAASVLDAARRFRHPPWRRRLQWAADRRQHALLYRSLGDLFQSHHQFVGMADIEALFPELPALPADFTVFRFAGHEQDAAARWMRGVELGFHLPRVLMKVDRASMHPALEVRMPLLDLEVLDVASRVDWQTCLDLSRREGKRPLRHALARRLRYQTTAKRGFTVPMDGWMRGVLRPMFEDVVLARADLVGLPLNRRALRSLHRQHLDRTANHGWLLWRLLSLALWADRRPTAGAPT